MADRVPPSADEVTEAFLGALAALDESRSDYAVLGGIAVDLYAGPRLTLDVDVVVSLPRVAWPGLLDRLASRGFLPSTPDRPGRTQADVLEELRTDSMTALWRGSVRLDLLEADDPLHAEALRRKTSVRAFNVDIPVVRAEHLLLTKWIAGRPKDLIDVDQVLAAQGSKLDLSIVRAWLPAIEASGGRSAGDFEDRVRRLVR